MANYRALILNSDNSIFSEETLSAEDDESAIAEARKLVHQHNIELWEGSRMVALLTKGGTITNREDI